MMIHVVRCQRCHYEVVLVQGAGAPVTETALAAAISGVTLRGVSAFAHAGLCAGCIADLSAYSDSGICLDRERAKGDGAHRHGSGVRVEKLDAPPETLVLLDDDFEPTPVR